MLYIVLVKKLGSHKETEENKLKYKSLVNLISQYQDEIDKQREREKLDHNEKRYFQSAKERQKKEMKIKRRKMEKAKAKK